TGAEKPRSSDGTGSSDKPEKVSVSLGSVSTCMPLASSRPSFPTRPKAIGITNGSFVGCPAVGGHDCAIVSLYMPASSSHWPTALTRGVPDCEYQRLNW